VPSRPAPLPSCKGSRRAASPGSVCARASLVVLASLSVAAGQLVQDLASIEFSCVLVGWRGAEVLIRALFEIWTRAHLCRNTAAGRGGPTAAAWHAR
jgi:hypothetical protein